MKHSRWRAEFLLVRGLADVSHETLSLVMVVAAGVGLAVIAVDGPAGVGKSTVAREVARRLGYGFISSGEVYRALAWVLSEAGWDGESAPDLERLEHSPLRLTEGGALMLGDEPLRADLRSERVSGLAARVATHAPVREVANRLLRVLVDGWIDGGLGGGRRKGVVLEGRDIGTVVYPEAGYKVFLTARVEVRAERRWRELQATQPGLTLQAVLANVRMRDQLDQTRSVAPLRAAEDALQVDTSKLTLEQVVEAVLQPAFDRITLG